MRHQQCQERRSTVALRKKLLSRSYTISSQSFIPSFDCLLTHLTLLLPCDIAALMADDSATEVATTATSSSSSSSSSTAPASETVPFEAVSSITSPRGVKLFCRHWIPEGTVPIGQFFLFHGLAEHSGAHSRLAEAILELGFAVHALDLSGQYGSILVANQSINQSINRIIDHAFVVVANRKASA